MRIVENIREYVENECKKPESMYGYEPFSKHFVSVVGYAMGLCDEIGGDIDREVVEIAAWSHDIGSIVSGRKDHHITGASIMEKKLMELDYPVEKIDLVKKCILNHRGSQQNSRDSIEEKIIADADAMSNYDNISGLFMAAFVYEHLNQEQAKQSVRRKLENKWNRLHFENSRKILKPRYEAAMLLLS
jgi:uncharacterized protein